VSARRWEAWLDFHRDTLLLKCADLTAGQLKERAVPPSRLSLLGLAVSATPETTADSVRGHAASWAVGACFPPWWPGGPSAVSGT
jgi:Protein of unknown function (DUF664)